MVERGFIMHYTNGRIGYYGQEYATHPYIIDCGRSFIRTEKNNDITWAEFLPTFRDNGEFLYREYTKKDPIGSGHDFNELERAYRFYKREEKLKRINENT